MSTAAAALLRGAAQSLQLPIDDTQVGLLLAYLSLLERWNATYNLTAIRDPAAMVTQHLIDCLAIIMPLQRHCGAGPFRLLDVGSGGGLPGIVIAVMQPMTEVICVDAVGKKVAFVRQVAAELRLPNLRGEHARVERLQSEPYDVITSRAFASLSDFVQLSAGLLREGGLWLAMKGRRPEDEIQVVGAHAEVFHVEHLDVPGLKADRCLVWMRRSSSAKLPYL